MSQRRLERTQAVDGRVSPSSGVMPPEYFVYAFGDNTAGQLLANQHTELNVPSPIRAPKISKQMVAYLACGPQTTYVVTEKGDVLGGGSNDNGQISLVTDDDSYEQMHKVNRAVNLEKFGGVEVRYVAAGAEHTVAVLENGAAVSYGTNEYGQLGQGENAISLKPRQLGAVQSLIHRGGVCTVACGRYFTLFLTRWGEVYACGDNTNGCLGIPSLKMSAEPKRISALAASPIVQIACGDDHCLALSLERRLYVWGRCAQGELGLGSQSDAEATKVIWEPRRVPVEGYILSRPKKIIAGANHSMLFAGNGEIWTTGLNTAGQCGHDPGDCPKIHSFKRVEGLPRGLRWIMGAAGQAHTCLVSATGQAFTFGRNVEGQLGIGRTSAFEYRPQSVTLPTGSAQLFVYGCATGGYHTVIAALPITLEPAKMNELVRLQSIARTSPSSSPGEAPSGMELEQLNTPSDEWLPGVPSVPLFRQESDVRPRKRSKRVMWPLQDSWSGEPQRHSLDLSLANSQLIRVPTVEVRILQQTGRGSSAPPQAGYRADELIKLYQKSKANGQIDHFRSVISSLFSNATRLNCSFLVRKRDPELDVTGLEAFYAELLGPDGCDEKALEHNNLMAIILKALQQLIEDIMPTAEHFKEADQVRFLLIALHCPVFSLHPLPQAVGTCLNSFYTVFRKMSCSGRREIFDIITNLYPAKEFQIRLVDPCRRLVPFILQRNIGKVLTAVDDLWDLMLFLEMCYLSNETVAAQRRVDEGSKRPGKIADDAFAVEFPVNRAIHPMSELRVMLESAALTRQQQQMGRTPTNVGTNPLNDPSVISSQTTDKGADDTSNSDQCAWRFSPADTLRVEGAIPGAQRFFLAHSNLLPTTFKRDVMRAEAERKRLESLDAAVQRAILSGEALYPHLDLVVKRDNVVQDALQQISMHHGAALLKPLRVHFVGEEGVDEGGLKREFFSLVCDKMFDPEFGMFTYDADSRCLWFTLKPVEGQGMEFALVGILLSLALYNDVILDLKLAPAVYKKLQGAPTDFSDLFDICPARASGMQKMLEMDCSSAEGRELFEMSFGMMNFTESIDFFGERREIPLREDGADIMLTPENRQEYVDLVADFYLNKGVESSFHDFKAGFLCMWNTDLLKLLTPKELQTLLVGSQDLNFDDLQKGARYEGGFNAEMPYIRAFWRILKGWDMLMKRKFLHFCTGSDRSPVGGLQELHLLVQKNGSEPTNRLPTAMTCFNCLLLPHYEDADKLERLLRLAVEGAEGFGLR